MGEREAPSDGAIWAGVDVGTQSLRVLLVDEHGTVVGRGADPLVSARTGDRHEQDPLEWWRGLGRASRQALRAAPAGAAARVRGLAMCSTSGTFLLADPDGAVRTGALMYDDARAVADVAEAKAAAPGLWTWAGPTMQPSWALPKLLWLARHGAPQLQADIAAARVQLRHCVDYLAERLCGHRVATDWSHALKTGFDVVDDQWPVAALEVLGLPPDLLPDVVRPGTTIGHISPAGAAHTGLPAGTPIRAGMTDGCAAQIAAGALSAGSWNSVLGTTLVLKGVTEQRLADAAGSVYSHRHPDGGWLPGGASNVGAGALPAAGNGADHARRDAAAARYEPASAILYPLVRRGERFPFVRPDAEPFETGRFVDKDDRYAAVLQAIAYVEKLSYTHLHRLGARMDGELSITGGATRSRYWCQLRADILGRELVRPASAEPAFGMAVVAAAGDGPLDAAARRLLRSGTVVTPRPEVTARFADPYASFVDALAERGWIDVDLARAACDAA